MIRVVCGENNRELRQYALDIVFGWLGLSFTVEFAAGQPDWLILWGGGSIRLPDIALAGDLSWGNPSVKHWNWREVLPEAMACDSSVPILFRREGHDFSITEREVFWNCDLFGTAALVLSRFEEVGAKDLDERGRFPGKNSHAHRNDYLRRPIIDEYVNILGAILARIVPAWEMPPLTGKTDLSHDVDHPFRYRAVHAARAFARSWKDRGLAGIRHCINVRAGRESDPYDTFGWAFTEAEKRNLSSTLYFISRLRSPLDGDAPLEHPALLALLREASRRGHSVGLHGSYLSYCRSDYLRDEAGWLMACASKVGVNQAVWRSRQHYLRWTPATVRLLEEAGLHEDASLGFHDEPGFRAGTARTFPFFDIGENRRLMVKMRPLVLMEATLLAPGYLGMSAGAPATLELAVSLKERCAKVGGTFSLLWHNNNLINENERRLFLEVLDA